MPPSTRWYFMERTSTPIPFTAFTLFTSARHPQKKVKLISNSSEEREATCALIGVSLHRGSLALILKSILPLTVFFSRPGTGSFATASPITLPKEVKEEEDKDAREGVSMWAEDDLDVCSYVESLIEHRNQARVSMVPHPTAYAGCFRFFHDTSWAPGAPSVTGRRYAALATDGESLFVHNCSGLFKVAMHGAQQGEILGWNPSLAIGSEAQMAFVKGSLLFRTAEINHPQAGGGAQGNILATRICTVTLTDIGSVTAARECDWSVDRQQKCSNMLSEGRFGTLNFH